MTTSRSRWGLLSFAAAFVSILAAGRPAPAQAPAEKTAGEARKNVTVLKEMPTSQIGPVMAYMSASLGTNCEFCHVRNGQQFEYDKDDKEKKKTARKMIQMVVDINKTSFEGKNEVTCYSCHQGHEKPVSEAPIGVARGPEPRPAPGQAAEAPPVPAKLIEKYVDAIGGKAAVDAVKSRTLKGSVVMGEGRNPAPTIEVYQQGPDKMLSVMSGGPQGGMTQGVNGTTGWMKDNRGLRDLAGDELAQQARVASVFGAVQVKEPYTRFRYAGKDKINDRDVYVLRLPAVAGKSERLYLDAENGLVLRRVLLTATSIGQLPEQFDFEDYRDVNGVKVPFTIRSSNLNARATMTRKFTEIQHNTPVDDKLVKPSAE